MRVRIPGAIAACLVLGVALAHAAPSAARVDDPPDFANACESEHFDLASDDDLELEPLAVVAETTQRRLRAWLGVTPRVERRTRICFCRDVEGLFALERSTGLVVSRAFHRDHPFHGRCYPEVGLIVIPNDRPAQLRWQVAHEVAHTVFHELVGRNVEIVNEGLAELVPYWILRTDEETPEALHAGYDLYDRRAAQAVLGREVPSLDRFLALDEIAFYDARVDWLWYALSWKLTKVLVENDDPSLRGRYAAFLRALGDGNTVVSALRSVYDSSIVETAWMAEVERTAAWKPLFGTWRFEAGALVGTATGWQSACAISTSRLDAGKRFELRATVSSATPGAAFGFAFDVRGPDDFVYVEFRPSDRTIRIAPRAHGAWPEVFANYPLADPLPLAVAPEGRRIALLADGDGLLRVLVDGQRVVLHRLNRDLQGGALGVMLERCDGNPSDSLRSEVKFRDVAIER